MKIIEEVKIKAHKQKQLTGYWCDVCQKEFKGSDAQEMIHIDTVGGYMSIFGDGSKIELDICQHCLKEKLGKYIRVSDWDGKDD